MVDIGANLTSFNNLDNLINESLEVLSGIIITGSTLKDSIKAINICEKYQGKLYSTVGVHPHHADLVNQDMMNKLEGLLSNNCVVAIGETGLDFNRNYSSKNNQIRSFRWHIKLALKYNKPLFLHERDASTEFLQILDDYDLSSIKVVVHCFTGTKKICEEYIRRGFYIGITGWLCDNRRNHDLLDAIKIIPHDKIMVETDCPYLKPPNVNGKNNVPKNLTYIIEKVAECIGKSYDEILQMTIRNTNTFFNLRFDVNKVVLEKKECMFDLNMDFPKLK